MSVHQQAKALETSLANARSRLQAAQDHRGAFCGELSSSALSTATAAMALAMANDPGMRQQARAGHVWLCENQNADGGWGDTIESPSNISTTLLAWSSLNYADLDDPSVQTSVERATTWLQKDTGDLSPAALAGTIVKRYGKDRTFSVPILTVCALAGRLGEQGWRYVPALPFELAACPHGLFHLLDLRTVSYALPALIAIGQVRHFHRPTRNPITWCLRQFTKTSTLRKLQTIQPASGGFLEAAPLTSFVVMSLHAMQQTAHPVVQNGQRFLLETVRPDGSWPIDTNLDTWLTSLSVHALQEDCPNPQQTLDWLVDQQYRQVHPYTQAAPGGWAWTDLSGGVPDADDTAGALLALHHLDPTNIEAASAGIHWLCKLANRNGGVPTFCRGFGRLPFDRSSPDITAHALRAWQSWRNLVAEPLRAQIDKKTCDAVDYLLTTQEADGRFIPLWFGNQLAPNQENPVYGTSRVLLAVAAVPCPQGLDPRWVEAGRRGVDWLLQACDADGGFGSIEETALALEALATWQLAGRTEELPARLRATIDGCVAWIIEHTREGTAFATNPIGLYFARLWYSERLYPLVFTVAALTRARSCDPDSCPTPS